MGMRLVENIIDPNPDAVVVSFEDFWAVWPKRLAKKDALKAWLRVPVVAHQKILRAVEGAKQTEQWLKEEGQYIPLPASWLRGERWEDEIATIVVEQCAWNRNGNRGAGGRCTKNGGGAKNGQSYCRTHLELM